MNCLPRFWQSRVQRAALGIAVLLLGLSGFLPLFGGPGYEAALAAGLILPIVVAIATALEVAPRAVEPWEALGRGLASGAVAALSGLGLSWLHGVRIGFCDPVQGSLLYLLGGGFGALMGGAWGALAGGATPWVRRRKKTVAVLLAAAGPITGVLVSLWRFYTSAMVFAFDPFFGVFSGPLYDTIVERTGQLWTYRVGSSLTLLAAAVLAASLERRPDGRFGLRRLPWGIQLVGALGAVGSLSVTWAGSTLGHFTTDQSLRQALGREVVVGRCEVVHAKTVLDRDALALGRECDGHLTQLEQFLATRAPEHVTVFLFASAADKGRLMGAAHTLIAKPWRKEIYLQEMGFPHPVVRHELAHVVLGSVGRGPFRVAGPLGGWMPDPGRIEGLAVAAAPDEDEDLTSEQWARAMLDLGLLPPLAQVFRLSFLGENSHKAYAVAGAFASWLRSRYGARVLGEWYGGAELGALTGGKSLGALEEDWRAALRTVPIPSSAMEAARFRFDRPAIFGRRCPRVVDRLQQASLGSLAAGDHRSARADLERLLRLDPGNVSARLQLATCALRAGADHEARERLAAVANDSHLRVLDRARAREIGADVDFHAGRTQAARSVYLELERLLVDPDRLRELELKRATAEDPSARRAVAALVAGDPQLGPNWGVAAAALGAWAADRPEDGTADYLLGRNFFQQGRWRDGAEHLERAVGRSLLLGRIRREALRMRLVVSCAEADHSAAKRAYARFLQQPDISPALSRGTAELAARCGALP